MEPKPARQVSDRDLRAISTAELLDLIAADIVEMDRLRPPKGRPLKEEKPRKGKLPEPVEEEEAPPEPLALHVVSCCDNHLGDFPSFATIRCPFCNDWLHAANFPHIS